jgi:excisionase family DNA binding protein
VSSQYVGTKEAADLLGVSEASVRRWSDAGLLAAHRVGRRGERRFARSDVLDLKSAGRQGGAEPPAAVLVEGHPIPIHTHLSTFYTSDRGRLRIGLPFLRDGIVAGQACILMTSPQTARLFAAELRADGVDVTNALETGHLQLQVPFETGDQGIDTFERSFSAVIRRAGLLIRVLGEALENRETLGSIADLLRFEERLSTLVRRYPVVMICQYDARRLDGKDLIGVLKAHADNFDQPLGRFLN